MNQTVHAKFVLKGDNQLQSAFSNAGRELATVAKQAAIAGAGLGALFARSVIKNTIESQAAIAQLNSSLQSTGRFSEEASAALQAHATALQQTSTFGDEAIMTAQSLLLTFQQIGDDVLPRTTQSVVDMSTKMGTDLKGAASQLGKALNDPITGLSKLSRIGVTFTEEQQDLIKSLAETGHLAEAQGLILDALESKFSGAALAARNTLGGALEAVKNNFGDLLEVTGDDSSGAVGALNELAATLADPAIKGGFQTLSVYAIDLLGLLAQYPSTIGFLKDELLALFGVIDDNDVVRLTEQLGDLQEELAEANGANIFGATWEAKAKVVQGEIDIIQEKLDNLAFSKVRYTPEMFGLTSPLAGTPTPAPAPPQPHGTGGDESGSQKLIDNLQFETSLIGLSNTAREQAIALRGLDSEATAAERAQIEQLIAVKNQLLEIENTSLEEIEVTAEKYQIQLSAGQQLIEQLQFEQELLGMSNAEREEAIMLRGMETEATVAQIEKARELLEQNQQLAEAQEMHNAVMGTFTDGLAEAFGNMVDGSMSAKEAFADMAKSILRDIARILIQQAILSAFGGIGGGAASGLASIFARADGGPVSANTPYLVGERGPEIIVPANAGRVIPNHQVGGNTVNVTIDARQNNNPASMLAMVPLIQKQVEQSMTLKMRRGYI